MPSFNGKDYKDMTRKELWRFIEFLDVKLTAATHAYFQKTGENLWRTSPLESESKGLVIDAEV